MRKKKQYTITYHRKGVKTNYPDNIIVESNSSKMALLKAKKKLGNKYVIEKVNAGNIFRWG